MLMFMLLFFLFWVNGEYEEALEKCAGVSSGPLIQTPIMMMVAIKAQGNQVQVLLALYTAYFWSVFPAEYPSYNSIILYQGKAVLEAVF